MSWVWSLPYLLHHSVRLLRQTWAGSSVDFCVNRMLGRLISRDPFESQPFCGSCHLSSVILVSWRSPWCGDFLSNLHFCSGKSLSWSWQYDCVQPDDECQDRLFSAVTSVKPWDVTYLYSVIKHCTLHVLSHILLSFFFKLDNIMYFVQLAKITKKGAWNISCSCFYVKWHELPWSK